MDYDNNGTLDLILGDYEGYVYLFRRNLDGTLSEGEKIKAGNDEILYPKGTNPQIIDWNEDGLFDLVLTTMWILGNPIRIYLNKGELGYPVFDDYDSLPYPVEIGGNIIRSSMEFVDLDKDGIRDIVLETNYSYYTVWYSQLWFYKNKGTNFAPVYANKKQLRKENRIKWSTLTCFDWNNNGFYDIFAGGIDKQLYMFEGIPFGGTYTEDIKKENYPIFDISFINNKNALIINFGNVGNNIKSINVYTLNGQLTKAIKGDFTNNETINVSKQDIGKGAKIFSINTSSNNVVNYKVIVQ